MVYSITQESMRGNEWIRSQIVHLKWIIEIKGLQKKREQAPNLNDEIITQKDINAVWQ